MSRHAIDAKEAEKDGRAKGGPTPEEGAAQGGRGKAAAHPRATLARTIRLVFSFAERR